MADEQTNTPDPDTTSGPDPLLQDTAPGNGIQEPDGTPEPKKAKGKAKKAAPVVEAKAEKTTAFKKGWFVRGPEIPGEKKALVADDRIASFTVVNDEGFMRVDPTKCTRVHMTPKPAIVLLTALPESVVGKKNFVKIQDAGKIQGDENLHVTCKRLGAVLYGGTSEAEPFVRR